MTDEIKRAIKSFEKERLVTGFNNQNRSKRSALGLKIYRNRKKQLKAWVAP